MTITHTINVTAGGPALRDFLHPRSIAIVGASKDPTKRGFRAIEKLLADGFPKEAIYPVNPKEAEILGLACLPSLEALTVPVDLALICTPARSVPGLLELCGAKGIKGAVVLAGGFAEAGEEGQALQDALVAAARAGGVRVVGPNTSGIFNTHAACNIAGFANLARGGVGLLSQSGNMALALVSEAEVSGDVGFSTYVGIGNEAEIRFHEYLAHLGEDDGTRVVVIYIEGLKDGRAFLDTLDRVSRRKPVVMFKSGRTSAGRRAAQSHTGALAGDFAVSAGVLRQMGAVIPRRTDEILPLAKALSIAPPPAGRRIAVLADGGGHATIASDLLTEHGLELATLSAETRAALAALLPPAAALGNPVDVAGATDADPAVFGGCVDALLREAGVDGLLIAGLFGGYGHRFSASLAPVETATSRRIARMAKATGKPVLVYSLFGDHDLDPLVEAEAGGIPVYSSLEIAVRCMQALAEVGESSCRPPRNAHGAGRNATLDAVISRCRTDKRDVVLEHEARQVLATAGVAMAPTILAATADAAGDAFRTLGGVPVAMKVVSRDIVHKSEAGGVLLNLRDETAVRSAFQTIRDSAERYRPGADLAGILVTPMAEPGGVEVIIGVVRDPQYGPVMMFGLGGVLVEVLKDVVFRALPLDVSDAREMLDSIAARAVLAGVRGAPPVDREALVSLMLAVSDLCAAHPEIAELDLNPVLAHPDGLAVLDARILLTGNAP
nr:acetate--CoA ligase [uncultured Azospirillum sp.]